MHPHQCGVSSWCARFSSYSVQQFLRFTFYFANTRSLQNFMVRMDFILMTLCGCFLRSLSAPQCRQMVNTSRILIAWFIYHKAFSFIVVLTRTNYDHRRITLMTSTHLDRDTSLRVQLLTLMHIYQCSEWCHKRISIALLFEDDWVFLNFVPGRLLYAGDWKTTVFVTSKHFSCACTTPRWSWSFVLYRTSITPSPEENILPSVRHTIIMRSELLWNVEKNVEAGLIAPLTPWKIFEDLIMKMGTKHIAMDMLPPFRTNRLAFPNQGAKFSSKLLGSGEI